MTLALSSEYPILDIFWTMLMAFGLAVLLWTIVVVFGDLFRRSDIGAGAKVLWVLLVLVLPIAGLWWLRKHHRTAVAEPTPVASSSTAPASE